MITLKELMLTEEEMQRAIVDRPDVPMGVAIRDAQLQKLIDRGDVYIKVGGELRHKDKNLEMVILEIPQYIPLSELEE